jgi:hypothetical protein
VADYPTALLPIPACKLPRPYKFAPSITLQKSSGWIYRGLFFVVLATKNSSPQQLSLTVNQDPDSAREHHRNHAIFDRQS